MGHALDDHDLHPGRVLGPYELVVPAGTGGMAQVWAARHLGTGAMFALKMLRAHLAENVSFRDMFFDEARIASRIRHENVARTYELVDLDGVLTLVMEWVDGTSLVRMLRPDGNDRDDVPRLALPVRHAAKILAETCAGLHAAHELVDERGRSLAVVHRDVSPHNVLLTRDGRVKVTDFGVAKALGQSHMTIAGQVKGKLAYMSPEQLVGGGIDRRSDVFALGSVLYEATTGQRPFQGEHDPQVMTAIIMGHCARPRDLVRGYPAALEQIVMRALATAPDDRYATALQLRQALEGWLAQSGPTLGAQQISGLLHERCGEELEERSSLLPEAPVPSAPTAPVSTRQIRIESGGPMEVDRRSAAPVPARSAVGLVGAAAAVVLGLLLGLGVLFYVKESRRTRAAAAQARADASAAVAIVPPAPSSTPPVVEPAPTNAVDLDETPPEATSPPVPMVALHAPPGAKLFVDGRELATGTDVPRPDAGFVAVLVRVDDREDTIVTVGADAPDAIDVVMAEPRKKHRKKMPVRPAGGDVEGAAPPNPYE